MNIHHSSYKKKIYEKYWKELRELKKNLEYTEQLNQWELHYNVKKPRNINRKYGTPILKYLERKWKMKNILKYIKKQKMETETNNLEII